MAEQNITMARGQDKTIKASMAKPRDITGWAITFQVKDSLGGTSRFTKTVGSGITVLNAMRGVISIAISAANTSALSVRSFVWDLRRTDAGSNTELARGELRLVEGVTE